MPSKAAEAVIERIHRMSAHKGAPGLARMRRLLERLGRPERALRVIHVAGTNGKGSVVQYIASVLGAAGYAVGVYTSPHVMVYNERYVVSGEMISDADFCRYAEMVLARAEPLAQEGYGYLSEFEILTAIAYLYFRDRAPDYVVLETGLGGRIDMTNVFEHPLVTVITEIGRDHTAALGDTLAAIAREKAGILKVGVPAVSGARAEEARSVIREAAAEIGAPLIDVSAADYVVRQLGIHSVFDLSLETWGKSGAWLRNLEIALPGEHQIRNALVAATALYSLEQRGLADIGESALRTGLRMTRHMGRFELLEQNPALIIDAAHNPQGIRAAMATLRDVCGTALEEKRLQLVFACFRDKDYETMVRVLAEGLQGITNCRVIATEAVSPRALPAAELAVQFRAAGLEAEAIPDEEQAYNRAEQNVCDITLFIGSIYLIGDIRIVFQRKGWHQHV